MLKILLGIIVFILILGVIVLIHEGGHFFFAKRAGILCYEFSIGMGPLIWQKKIGETYYSIRAIPIGGYVSMAGEEIENNLLKDYQYAHLTLGEDGKVKEIFAIKDLEGKMPENLGPDDFYQIIGSDLIGTKEELPGELFITILQDGAEVRYEAARDCLVRFTPKQAMQIAPYNRLFVNKKLLQRFLTIFAGPFMNFVLALGVFFFLGLASGYTNYKTTVLGSVEEATPAYEAGLRTGDEVIYIGTNEVTYNNWQDISDQMAIYAKGQDFSGSVLLTYERDGVRYTVTINPYVYVQTIQLLFVRDGSDSLVVDEYPNNNTETMTYKAGLQKGDVLISINDVPFENRMQVLEYFSTGDGANTSKFRLKVLRNGETVELNEIESYQKAIFDDNGIEVCKVLLGISPTVTRNIGRLLWEPLKKVGSSCTVIIKTLGRLFRPKSGLKITDLSGPVGIASATISIIDQGAYSIFNWMAILSVNIGLMNIIPLPALDGGRLAFILYEVITRKKPNPKVENIIHTIGFILLMVLFVFVAFNDVIKLIFK